jgi:hypothetical protein
MTLPEKHETNIAQKITLIHRKKPLFTLTQNFRELLSTNKFLNPSFKNLQTKNKLSQIETPP